MAIASTSVQLPEISETPHQPWPVFRFPKHYFAGEVVFWSFQSSWFQQWPFLHYNETNDLAYCHTCVMGFKEKKVKTFKADPAFGSEF